MASTNTAAKATARSRKPSPLPLVLLALTSIAFGVAINYMGTKKFPRQHADLAAWTSRQLLQDLNLKKDWLGPQTEALRKHAPDVERFALLITKVFATLTETPTGQGLFLIIASVASPTLVYWTIEGQKDGQSELLTIAYAMVVSLIGQVIMIGSAGPIFLIPAYAYARWAEVSRSPKVVHPLPSPASWKVAAIMTLNTLVLGTFLLVIFTPYKSEQWMTYNALFQFFPLIWTPALAIPRRPTVVSSEGSAAARQTPRLSASNAYRALSYFMFVLYAAGLYLAFSGIKTAVRRGFLFDTIGEHVIFVDCIGCAALGYLVVLVDSMVDEAKVARGSVRTHERRLILEDALIGAPALLLFGPGWGMAKYLQRREILAEKARFGIKEE